MTTNQAGPGGAGSTALSDTNAMRQRILAATEKDGRRGKLEVALAIILSLATLTTTWCNYQARRWSGVA